jgi:hypothetical protein
MSNLFEFDYFFNLLKSKVNSISKIKMTDSDTLAPSYKNKFWLYKKIHNNIFFKNIDNQLLIDSFISVSKSINIIKRKITYIKKNNYINNNDFDLSFKTFNENDNDKITLFLNNTKYNFRNYELNNLCLKSLLIDSYLFPTPQIPRNPYTNIQFSPETLFIIYFKLVNTKTIIDPLITSYFQKSFDLNEFVCYFDGIIQDKIISYTAKNSIDDEFWKYEYGCFISHIAIHVNLSSHLINYRNNHNNFVNFYINPIRKYLKLYLLLTYSKLSYRKDAIKRKLHREFRLYLRNNFEYGRFFAIARRNLISLSPRQSPIQSQNNSNSEESQLPELEDNDTDSLIEHGSTNNNELINSVQQQIFNQINQLSQINTDTSFNLMNNSWNMYLTDAFNNIETDILNNHHDEIHNIDESSEMEIEPEGSEPVSSDEEAKEEELYESQLLEASNKESESESETESENEF